MILEMVARLGFGRHFRGDYWVLKPVLGTMAIMAGFATIAGEARLGLRPHRNRMTLQHSEIQGNLVSPSQPFGKPLFTSGQDGYYCYRIPALAVTSQGHGPGDCEGRNSFSDAGEIDLLVERSTDNGKDGAAPSSGTTAANTCGNPCVVVDRETGGIWLASSRNNSQVFMIHRSTTAGPGVQRRRSPPTSRNPTGAGMLPAPAAASRSSMGSTRDASSSPATMASNELLVACFYSDDHGKTWTLGGTTQQASVNECAVVELADGRLMLNMRNYNRSHKTRQIAFSDDGGMIWKTNGSPTRLIEPVCQAAMNVIAGRTRTNLGSSSSVIRPREGRNMTVRPASMKERPGRSPSS